VATDRPTALLLLLLLLLEDRPDVRLLGQGPLGVISNSCTAGQAPLLRQSCLLPLLQLLLLLLLLSLLVCSRLSSSTCLVLLCFQ
jgi:hypothetical protein